jgi:8-oxo-dGTP diphosphatase
MFKYTLAFLLHKNKALVINRNKSPWMGSWNGLGGKIKQGETPLVSVHREVLEETGLDLDIEKFIFKGCVTWNVFTADGQGLYIYIYRLDDDFIFNTPIKVEEGILDFKDISWLSNYDNEGVAKNIPYFLDKVINDPKIYEFECIFDKKLLVKVNVKEGTPCLNLS